MNQYGKVFRKIHGNEVSIIIENYSISQDYYSFVREKSLQGNQQVIITSEIMLKLLDYYFLNRGFSISDIEFMEDDDKLLDEMKEKLLLIKSDRAYYKVLTERLAFISNDSSIDIKKISVSNKIQGKYVNIFWQVNGVVAINAESFDVESKNIISEIKRCLNI